MPHTSLREAAPTATLSTSAPCPMPHAPLGIISVVYLGALQISRKVNINAFPFGEYI